MTLSFTLYFVPETSTTKHTHAHINTDTHKHTHRDTDFMNLRAILMERPPTAVVSQLNLAERIPQNINNVITNMPKHIHLHPMESTVKYDAIVHFAKLRREPHCVPSLQGVPLPSEGFPRRIRLRGWMARATEVILYKFLEFEDNRLHVA